MTFAAKKETDFLEIQLIEIAGQENQSLFYHFKTKFVEERKNAD